MPESVIACWYSLDASLSNTWCVGLIPAACIRSNAFARVKIISPSVLFFIGSAQMELLSTWYSTIMYLLPLLDINGNLPV